MKIDLTGYPKTIRPRQPSVLSKIVTIADSYDAATSRRVYKTEPLAPSAVLEEMRDNPRRGLDQVLVKAFINLLGIYPVGTLVVLDTFELGHRVSGEPEPRGAFEADRQDHQRRAGQHDQSAAHGGSRRSRGGRPVRALHHQDGRPGSLWHHRRRLPHLTQSRVDSTRFARSLAARWSAMSPPATRISSARWTILRALEEGGADIIELGVPFSDPIADGPIIQASSQRALENGMNFDGALALDRARQARRARCAVQLPEPGAWPPARTR